MYGRRGIIVALMYVYERTFVYISCAQLVYGELVSLSAASNIRKSGVLLSYLPLMKLFHLSFIISFLAVR